MRKMFPLLKSIPTLGDEERNTLLRHLSNEACSCVLQCVWNGLTNPTLSEDDRRVLRQELAPQKKKFRKLFRQLDPTKQRQTLLQVGAGAGLILEKVLPLLDDTLGDSRKKKAKKQED